MFLNEEKDEDHKVFMFLLVRVLKIGLLHGPYCQRKSFMKLCYGTWLHLIKKKSPLISHTVAYIFPNKMFLYEPTALITEHKSHRTMAGLCEKENSGLPLNPIAPWMCCIKINQGHHYSFSLWFGFPSNYILCISEITAPPPLTEFDITLINVSFQNERQKCQIPTIINSFNSLICIK